MSEAEYQYGYVYKTTNLINGRYYIGMHRASIPGEQDKFYLGSGVLLKQAIALYGRDNFEQKIISWHKNREEMQKAEIKEIKRRREQDKGKPIQPVGRGEMD